jgi:hypothetical protein
VLETLYSHLDGGIAEVAKRVGIRKQQQLFSPICQQNRLSNNINSAVVVNQVSKDGEELTTVHW